MRTISKMPQDRNMATSTLHIYLFYSNSLHKDRREKKKLLTLQKELELYVFPIAMHEEPESCLLRDALCRVRHSSVAIDIVLKNSDLRLVFLKDIVYRGTDLLTSMIMIISL